MLLRKPYASINARAPARTTCTIRRSQSLGRRASSSLGRQSLFCRFRRSSDEGLVDISCSVLKLSERFRFSTASCTFGVVAPDWRSRQALNSSSESTISSRMVGTGGKEMSGWGAPGLVLFSELIVARYKRTQRKIGADLPVG